MRRRTHMCGELRSEHENAKVSLAGWVDARRDHGANLLFIDLRDRQGICQLTIDGDEVGPEGLRLAEKLRYEDVVAAEGIVRARAGGPNPKLDTGEVEVVVTKLELLSRSEVPPFLPGDEKNLPAEDTRLKHRHLDLRRLPMQRILQTRHRVTKIARDYFDEHGFLEIETPVLCRSTPEGARDYLVPSRLRPGSFYALPQSPQLFKQLLMVAGCDRYMQICRCFRDEDPRADRQAEFSQIDLEMSFVDRDIVLETMEGFVRRAFYEVEDLTVPPMKRMTYREAMDTYGIDRPDLRYGLELHDVSDIVRGSDFRVFAGALEKRRGVVKAFRAPGGASLSRKVLDGYGAFVKQFGAGGAPFVKFTGGSFEGGVAKFVDPYKAALVEALGLKDGDLVLFGADDYGVATRALGELRQKVAQDLRLIDETKREFAWVVDFPMFEYDNDNKRFVALHHPFTAPRADQLEALMAIDPTDHSEDNIDRVEAILSDGYDMVLNGSEIGGGSIRIHRQEVQAKVFDLIGLTRGDAKLKFGFLLDALTHGAPPHGGIAFGLDRLVMHLCRTNNIRDVMAFPKTMTGQDLLTDAPNVVDESQLEELHIRVVEE